MSHVPDASANCVDIHLGQRVRGLRRAAGLTQSELGGRVGVTFQQVQKYEAGKNRISASILFALCGVLGVDPGTLFEGLKDGLPLPVAREPRRIEESAHAMGGSRIDE
jgi:transcriptional regulator with XRE-family HTH domain